jgi:subtilisin family serine protease
MAREQLRVQVERILDEATGPTVGVIVQARETDATVRSLATAVAAATASRRLVTEPAELRRHVGTAAARSARSRRPPETAHTTATARAALRPLLGVEAVRRAASRSGEDPRAVAVVPLPAARSVALSASRDDVAAIAAAAEVAAVYPNRVLRVPRVFEVRELPAAAAESRASSWGVERVGALATWGAYNVRGKGVKVGVLDTGVDPTHPDLTGKIANWAEFNAQGDEVRGSTAHDSDRHGTHVCGTIVGGNASGSWIGVAPAARLAVGLVLDGEQGGTDAQVLAGIGWALERNVHVLSMSLGGLVLGPETPGTYTRALVECYLHGVPVVAAIGNEGAETSGSPGNDLFAIAVGAVDAEDGVAAFSGGRTQVITQSTVVRPELLPLPYPKPDVSGPGVAVTSSVPGGTWTAFSGTSMATPHVSGVVALVLAATGNLAAVADRDRVGVLVDLLAGTAAELGETGQDHRYGFERVDALRAIGLARDRGL